MSNLANPLAVLLAGGVLLGGATFVLDDYQLFVLVVPLVMAMFTVSLAFIWGFAGILCFGQGLYFGVGAYVFAVVGLNTGSTSGAVLAAVAGAALVAALFGYFMFFGRLSEVYLGIVTMVTTLIAWKLMNSVSGPGFQIGRTPLGGFNGIPSLPMFAFPGQAPLDTVGIFLLVGSLLIGTMLAFRLLLMSRFGRVVVAVRENEARAAMLGYDVRVYKLSAFVIAAAAAGLAGALYATSQSFVDPSVFSLEMSAQVLVWVMTGGVGSLVGPVIASFALQLAGFELASVTWLNSPLILGTVFCIVAAAMPGGGAGLSRRLLSRVRR